MIRSLGLLVGACVLVPVVALAQGAAAPPADKPAVTFDEVERGFYLGVQAGPAILLRAPSTDGKGPMAPGQAAQLELGVDIGEVLRLGVFLNYAAHKAGSDYVGLSGGSASGDFSTLVPGASLRAMVLGLPDAQDVKRTWFFAKAGAGYALFAPRQLLPNPDIMMFLGAGMEYYTRLRHFSVGIEVTGSYLVSSKAMGVSLTPSLRYAF
jgi:hypothetical protein